MQLYDAKNIKYRDKLAAKRRRIFILKTLFFVGLAIVLIGFILYFLFFSRFLDVKEVSVSGLDKVSKEKFDEEFNKRLGLKWLGYLEHQKKLIFFDSDAFKAEALTAFPEIKNISIGKYPPSTLKIDIIERKTAGIWCFVSGCKYFDEEGNTWGEAARSSGFLILNIDDNRELSEQKIETILLDNIMLVSNRLKEMNIFVNKFIIPEDFIGDLSVTTSENYDIILSADSDINGQLDVLKIFLTEKQKEPSPLGEFNPQYIDLRIDGRVYYK